MPIVAEVSRTAASFVMIAVASTSFSEILSTRVPLGSSRLTKRTGLSAFGKNWNPMTRKSDRLSPRSRRAARITRPGWRTTRGIAAV